MAGHCMRATAADEFTHDASSIMKYGYDEYLARIEPCRLPAGTDGGEVTKVAGSNANGMKRMTRTNFNGRPLPYQ